MACHHLQQIFQLCADNQIKVGGTDLVRFVCQECGEQEVCPSVLMEEYDSRQPAADVEDADGDGDG
jgi:hypothetical protein